MVNLRVKARLSTLNGYNKDNLKSYYFKAEAVTWAASNGLDAHKIHGLGRWKSNCYNLYIHNDNEMVLDVSRRLQA